MPYPSCRDREKPFSTASWARLKGVRRLNGLLWLCRHRIVESMANSGSQGRRKRFPLGARFCDVLFASCAPRDDFDVYWHVLVLDGSEKLQRRRKRQLKLERHSTPLKTIERRTNFLLLGNGLALAVATLFPRLSSFIFLRDLSVVLGRFMGGHGRKESRKKVQRSH